MSIGKIIVALRKTDNKIAFKRGQETERLRITKIINGMLVACKKAKRSYGINHWEDEEFTLKNLKNKIKEPEKEAKK